MLGNAPREVFSKSEVDQELEGVRKESHEVYSTDESVIIPADTAFKESMDFLKQIRHTVLKPDIMWLEDGGIGMEWRTDDGIITASFYGNSCVVFCASFADCKNEFSGSCLLSNNFVASAFVTMLRSVSNIKFAPAFSLEMPQNRQQIIEKDVV